MLCAIEPLFQTQMDTLAASILPLTWLPQTVFSDELPDRFWTCKLSLIAALSIVSALDWEILKLPWTTAARPSRDRSIPHEGPRNPLTSPAPFLSQIPPEAKMRHAVQAG